MQTTYTPPSPIDVMMPSDFAKLERALPSTEAAALRAVLEGILEQEARGEDVRERFLAVCRKLDC